jgi:DNA mismatch repair protein MutL
MSSHIQLLPDHVANQIAAGEVIQRPASAVKELLENAVDAGARNIQLIVKDGGRTLIQVIDNGSGMNEFDARLCFARHATSKLRQADDLWSLRTMGFRGEALASIAAVAQVEMRTRRKEEETGCLIEIEGSEITRQEPTACQQGTSIAVRNLFFNVPARRNFLKSNQVETRHIFDEFYRVALAFPEIAFSLINQGDEVHRLMPGSFKQRIVAIYGQSWNEKIIQVSEENTAIKITGFIGKPDFTRKTRGEQFFFINNRFIKSTYLHHAVQMAYQDFIPAGDHSIYFIRFDVPPSSIDINIHPTKTEIKFEDDRTAYGILLSSIRKALGAFSLSPSLDFEAEMQYVPLPTRNTEIKAPEIKVNPDYNPFAPPKPDNSSFQLSKIRWDDLEGRNEPEQLSALPSDSVHAEKSQPWLLHGTYICSQVKSGLMLIDLQGARERILYERFCKRTQQQGASQQLLFPTLVELPKADYALFGEIEDELQAMGFDYEPFGDATLKITGVPAEALNADARQSIEQILESYRSEAGNHQLSNKEKIAKSLARIGARCSDKFPGTEQMLIIIEKLFACESGSYSPSGRNIVQIIPLDELNERFQR